MFSDWVLEDKELLNSPQTEGFHIFTLSLPVQRHAGNLVSSKGQRCNDTSFITRTNQAFWLCPPQSAFSQHAVGPGLFDT